MKWLRAKRLGEPTGSQAESPSSSPPAAVPAGLDLVAGIAWRCLVILVALAVIVFALVELLLIVIPVIVAVLISTLLVPPARWLQRRGWPRFAATWSVLLGAIFLIVAVGALIAPGVGREFAELGPAVAEGVERVERWVTDRMPGINRDRLEDFQSRFARWFEENAEAVTSGVVSGAVFAVEFVAGFLMTLVLVFFFVNEGDKITGWMLERVPARHQEVARALARRSWTTIGGYVKGVAVVGVFNAVFIGIGLFILGTPLVVPLMLLTLLSAFFPLVGAVLAGAVAALVALVSGGPVDALIVVAIVVGVQQFEGHVLSPLVLARAVKLHPVVVLLVLVAGAIVGGVIGAFIAVPLTAIAAAVGNELRMRQRGRLPN